MFGVEGLCEVLGGPRTRLPLRRMRGRDGRRRGALHRAANCRTIRRCCCCGGVRVLGESGIVLALKGRDKPAQGNALGLGESGIVLALKGRHNIHGVVGPPFQGLGYRSPGLPETQGVALGWRVPAFQAAGALLAVSNSQGRINSRRA